MTQEPETPRNSEVPSDHESDASPSESGSDSTPRKDGVHADQRPEWGPDLSGVEPRGGADATEKPDADHQRAVESDDPESVDSPTWLTQVLAQIQAHLYLPMELPDSDKLAELRTKDPAAHRMFLREIKKQRAHQRFMESARYRMPLKTIRGAQGAALAALAIVAGVAIVALLKGNGTAATIIASFDVLGIMALFLNSKNED